MLRREGDAAQRDAEVVVLVIQPAEAASSGTSPPGARWEAPVLYQIAESSGGDGNPPVDASIRLPIDLETLLVQRGCLC